jgi:hypothetical protein
MDTTAASLFPLSAVCSGSPLEMDKQHFLSLANETGYLKFKEREPFKFSKKYPAAEL